MKLIKLIMLFNIFCMLLTFSGCSKEKPVTNNESMNKGYVNENLLLPTPLGNENVSYDGGNEPEMIYYFNVSKEWDALEYEKTFGEKLSYFSAPIQSPYKYTYQCESKDMTIDEVANLLGTIMMEDFMQDYEGKAFVITEYKNMVAHVMNGTEYIDWVERYHKAGKNIVLEENQWLCTFTCDYKYTGVYSNIGEMPADLEWMKTLVTDGSGEDHVFIIQKVDNEEYIMRGLPKTIIEELRKQ